MSITLRIDKLEAEVVPEVDYQPTRIIQHNKAVICFFADGSKTVSIPSGGDGFDLEKGVAMCVAKRVLGGYSGVKKAIEGVEEGFVGDRKIHVVEWDNIRLLNTKESIKKYGRFILSFIHHRNEFYVGDNYDWSIFDTESEARAWLREKGAK